MKEEKPSKIQEFFKKTEYSSINLARAILLVPTAIVAYLYGNQYYIAVSIFFLSFSLVWLFLTQSKIIDESQNPNWGFVPTTIDILLTCNIIFVTGTLNSIFLVILFYITILCSLNTKIPQGIFSAVFGDFLFLILIWIEYKNLIPDPSFYTVKKIQYDPLTLFAGASIICSSNFGISFLVQTMARKNQELYLLSEERLKKSEQSNRSVREFFANVSHELRTPLNGILGNVELLKYEYLTPNLQLSLNQLEESSKHLLGMINDVLDFSKIESGNLLAELRSFDLMECVHSSLTIVQSLSEKKSISIELEIDPELSQRIISDELRVRQILVNLLGNAIKFSSEQSSIFFRVQKRKNELLFSVEDSGIGIESSKLDIIFEPFQQSDTSTSRKYSGTGLGLPISKKFANLLRGDILVESILGKGSKFILVIPYEIGSDLDTNESVSYQPFSYHLNILVVDDNEINSNVLKRILDKLGHAVTTASSGKSGVALALEQNFHLVFMDIQMPEMDGYAAAKLIKEEKPEQPIVALTANAFLEDRNEVFASGMDGFLTKPIEKNKLVEILNLFASISITLGS